MGGVAGVSALTAPESRKGRDVVEEPTVGKLYYLAQIDLLSSLSAEDLETMDRMAPTVSLPAGTLVYGPGEPLDRLYFLKRGRVRLYSLSESGRQLTLALLQDGNVFGETDSFATGAGSCYAETVTPSLLCSMSTQAFRTFMEVHPEVATRMVEILSKRLMALQELSQTLVFDDVETRVLLLLIKLGGDAETPGFTRVGMPLTQQEIAGLIGSTRESVSLALGALATYGIVKTGRGTVWIDRQKAHERLHPG